MSHHVIKGGAFLIEDRTPEEFFTPEDFTGEHKMILNTALAFVKKEVWPRISDIEAKTEGVSKHLLAVAGELGLNGTDIPEAYGGLGLDKISTAVVTEAMGGAAAFATSHGAHTGIGTLPIVYFGTEEQKQKYLPALASGEAFGAYALTESGAGSDALNAKTKAVLSDDGKYYILNGEKMFITNAGWAETFITYAKVDGDKFTAFIVERGFPGVSVGAEEKKMGIHGSSTRTLILEDAKVPVENVLHAIGKGHQVAFNILNIGRYKLGAATVGACKVALEAAVKYAKGRIQFGQSIANFGLIKEKLARMAVSNYMAESIIYRISGLIDTKLHELEEQNRTSGQDIAEGIEEYAIECSIAKVYGSETASYVMDEMVQIYGGYGYVSEYPAERMYRDCRINRIYEGTNEINRMIIPGTLMRRAMKGQLPLMDALQKLTPEIMAFDPKAVKLGEGPLAVQQQMIKMCKKIGLMTAGLA
ncbi:MAG: acyl-CoA dehydrogenase family protein, partial [Deltaproteobacteria bacterium]|nr:acyl-CoA dehydrogenase family protein [Deltaproteobacteria bacterium]